MALLSYGNPKLQKSRKFGYVTAGVALMPHTTATKKSTCPYSTSLCREHCLSDSGAVLFFKQKFTARTDRTKLFFQDRNFFLKTLYTEIAAFDKRIDRMNKKDSTDIKKAIRLNVTSDLSYEKFIFTSPTTGEKANIFDHFPNIQFYDYTHSLNRAKNVKIKNYDLTYSYDVSRDNDLVLNNNAVGRVAVIYEGAKPDMFLDGDKHDLRFLEPKNAIVGLKLKKTFKKNSDGKYRQNKSGVALTVNKNFHMTL